MKGSSYISIGYNFLQLATNSIDELMAQGNRSLIMTSGNKSDEEAWREYEEKTKWNDQNVAIPILFNFSSTVLPIPLIFNRSSLFCMEDLPILSKFKPSFFVS